jgi:hypothetical protein
VLEGRKYKTMKKTEKKIVTNIFSSYKADENGPVIRRLDKLPGVSEEEIREAANERGCALAVYNKIWCVIFCGGGDLHFIDGPVRISGNIKIKELLVASE